MNKKILITGASGFIGSFLVEEALSQGMETWAAVRHSSSREYLQDKRIRFIELDFGQEELLRKQLLAHQTEHGAWDVVIHCAGATKCLHPEDFDKHNYQATVHLVQALVQLNMCPSQFIYISSLSIFGPIRETATPFAKAPWVYLPICEEDQPQPNTAYGRSKVKSEQYLRSLTDFPYLIFRPTGVYGPRERDYFLMAKSIRSHVDFSVGRKRQELTFVYVKDLVKAIFLGIEKGVTHREYFVSDGAVYKSRTFSDLIQQELGNPWVMHINAPLGVLHFISVIAETVSGWFGKTSTLNRDKYRIMKQRNWQCNIQPLVDELGYHPDYPLKRGVKEIITWYKQAGWL